MTTDTLSEQQTVPKMIPAFAPIWADVFGEDRCGVFAEFTLNRVSLVWRWIPPGRFLMGSLTNELGRDDDEGPQHEVTISRGFWLGETPVTQVQWRTVMGDNPSRFQGDQRPVEQVNWHQCCEFASKLNEQCAELNASLPTEAQWEYACRAGTQGAFHIMGSQCTQPMGKDPVLDQLGWFSDNSGGATHDVKQKAKNPWGLYDMHGNVWEWCLDGKREYQSRSGLESVGPMDEGGRRVVRGGSWGYQARYCRAAYRFRLDPGLVWGVLGFRLSAGLEPVLIVERSVPTRRSRG